MSYSFVLTVMVSMIW